MIILKYMMLYLIREEVEGVQLILIIWAGVMVDLE
jgi:hypothetical protein